MKTIYSNHFWEKDKHGNDEFDYARLDLFEQYAEEEGWETIDDISDERVRRQVYDNDELEWIEFKDTLDSYITDSKNGFLLCGTCGRWDGNYEGGCYVNRFDDLNKFWKDCRDIKVYDEHGHLYIEATHHDGTNYGELKEITDKGMKYKENHPYDSDKEVHSVLFGSNFYTRLPHFAREVYGCKED